MPLSPTIWIIFIICIQESTTYEACDGNYCPPRSPKPKINPIDNEALAPVFLGRDRVSGCTCREYPDVYVVCYGRVFCRRTPVEVNITAPTLKLTSTHIFELGPDDFDNVAHLQALQVEGNLNLSRILSGTFSNLTKLTNLSISFNPNLRYLHPLSFEGLISLRVLLLKKNGFEDIYDIAITLPSKILPKLQILSLNENNFNKIAKYDFAPMKNSSLEELNMVLCRLEYLHQDSLSHLKELQVLRLGENTFNSSVITNLISRTVDAGIPLKLLNLYSVGFRKAPPKKLMEVLGKSNVTTLTLARNQFEVISSDFFPYMPNLRILDLREVLALEIKNNTFTNLPNLRTLLLNGNKLPTIPEGVLLDNLTYLDLQQNSGNLYYQSYFSLSNEKFYNMKQLKYLNLNFNRLNNLFNDSFLGLSNLKILGLKNATIYHIPNNTFLPLFNLIFLNLENNYFFVSNNPPGIEADLFKGLDKLQVLVLAGCGISYLSKNGNPFRYLKSLEHLDLSRNRLQFISATYFSDLIQLTSIDLSENYLTVWDNRVFEENIKLRIVDLNINKITMLTRAMLEDFYNLTDLKIRYNPFSCDCRSYNVFNKWILQQQVIPTFINIKSHCIFPDSTSNYTLLEYFQIVHNGTISCDMEHLSTNLVVVLPLVLLVIFFITLAMFVYYYRWHIRYWIFLTRLYLSRKGRIKPKTEKTVYANYVYDAFVSYSNEDRNFVVRLVTMLENYEPFLKLCVYERDFQIGTIISESVLESVAQSRRTLLIISDNYAKSQWCRWESQIAEHHRLFFENETGEYVDDSLVLIKLGPVSENHLTPTLKYLLKTRIYLQWEANEKKQKTFWDKLRTALAPPKHEQTVLECTHI